MSGSSATRSQRRWRASAAAFPIQISELGAHVGRDVPGGHHRPFGTGQDRGDVAEQFPVSVAGAGGEQGVDTRVTGSLVVLRLDRVEVAHGVAVVFPLLVEDRVQARQGGLLVFGVVRVPARRGQLV